MKSYVTSSILAWEWLLFHTCVKAITIITMTMVTACEKCCLDSIKIKACTPKNYDPDVTRTRSLLIWSQTRYQLRHGVRCYVSNFGGTFLYLSTVYFVKICSKTIIYRQLIKQRNIWKINFSNQGKKTTKSTQIIPTQTCPVLQYYYSSYNPNNGSVSLSLSLDTDIQYLLNFVPNQTTRYTTCCRGNKDTVPTETGRLHSLSTPDLDTWLFESPRKCWYLWAYQSRILEIHFL